VYNAGNRKDIRQAEKASKIIERQNAEFISAALSTPQGRTWFHNLLVSCHLFADPFTGDALWEAHSKGERNVGLRIYTDILSNCPDQFVRMMREANARNIRTDKPEPDADDADGTSQYDIFDTAGDSE
jgi:hypothetical protein